MPDSASEERWTPSSGATERSHPGLGEVSRFCNASRTRPVIAPLVAVLRNAWNWHFRCFAGVVRYRVGCFLGFAVAGCLPFAAPPAQVSVTGAASNADLGESGDGAPADDIATGVQAKAGLNPLQAVRDRTNRHYDFGAGYTVESVGLEGHRLLLHGPYAHVEAFPIVFGRERVTRIGLRGGLELFPTRGPDTELGYGGSVGILIERARFLSGSFTQSSSREAIAGLAHGEGAIGAYLGVSQRALQDDSHWVGGAGLTVRLPAMAGIVCCAVPNW